MATVWIEFSSIDVYAVEIVKQNLLITVACQKVMKKGI